MKVLMILFTLLLCAATAHALPITTGQKAVMDKIEPTYVKGDDKAVLKEAEKLLPTLQSDVAAQIACYLYIAESRQALGDKAGAYAALEAAHAIDEKDPLYIFSRAMIRTRDGQGKDAFQECRRDARKQPDDIRKELDQLCRQTYANSRRVSAAKLWNDFDANEVAAEQEYKGQMVAVEGKIARIGTSALGYPEVTFNADNTGVHMVNCQFPKDARADIAKLKKGQKLTVAGICRAFSLGAVVTVDSCWILE